MKKIRIRKAIIKDAEQIVSLLEELGYPSTVKSVKSKIKILEISENNTVVVAEAGGKVVGVAHLHIAELFHEAGRLGRVMAIVVKDEFRGYGVGERLMDSLETIARKSGCVKMEVTSSIHRSRAHEFYKNLDYKEKPKRFVKLLE